MTRSSSVLAKAYGVTAVPEDANVAAYVASQQERFLALSEPEEPTPPEPVVTVATTPAEAMAETPVEQAAVPAVAAEDPLAIKQPLGIIGSPSDAPAGSSDWGLSTTFNISRDGLRSGYAPKVGLSVNPFFKHNNSILASVLPDGRFALLSDILQLVNVAPGKRNGEPGQQRHAVHRLHQIWSAGRQSLHPCRRHDAHQLRETFADQ